MVWIDLKSNYTVPCTKPPGKELSFIYVIKYGQASPEQFPIFARCESDLHIVIISDHISLNTKFILLLICIARGRGFEMVNFEDLCC